MTPDRKSLHMGQIDMSQSELDTLIISLGEKYTGASYHLMGRNCNHFSAELISILCNKTVPGWINRLAGFGKSCVHISKRLICVYIGALMPCFTDTGRDPANTAGASQMNNQP